MLKKHLFLQFQSRFQYMKLFFHFSSYAIFIIIILTLSIKLMPHTQSNKSQWSNEEIELLRQLYPKFMSKKWKNISKSFKKRGFSRNQSQCRQKWTNFIDPKINSEEWTEQELIILYQNYQKFGSRWSLVQKNLKGRTQNKIKNRFYGTLRNMLRFILQKFNRGSPSYTILISKLSPLVLNSLYKSTQNFSFLKNQIKQTVMLMNYKMEKNIMSQRIKSKRQLYSSLNKQMMQIFENIKKKQEEEILSSIEANQEAVNQEYQRQFLKTQENQKPGSISQLEQRTDKTNKIENIHQTGKQQQNQNNQKNAWMFNLDRQNAQFQNFSSMYNSCNAFEYPFFYMYYSNNINNGPSF